MIDIFSLAAERLVDLLQHYVARLTPLAVAFVAFFFPNRCAWTSRTTSFSVMPRASAFGLANARTCCQ